MNLPYKFSHLSTAYQIENSFSYLSNAKMPIMPTPEVSKNLYRSGTVNSNTVNSKFHLIRSYL